MERTTTAKASLLPLSVNGSQVQWGLAGGGPEALEQLQTLLQHGLPLNVTVLAPAIDPALRALAAAHKGITLAERPLEGSDFAGIDLLLVATGNAVLDETILAQARQHHCLVYNGDADLSDFVPAAPAAPAAPVKGRFRLSLNSEQSWRSLTSRIILVFFLAFVFMVIGNIIGSYLPSFGSIVGTVRPYFNGQFIFFMVAGFLAQMVDGTLGMGYGVTSATCLMSFGISPVSVSAAIHTSEIFTTATSGYSHYKFGNVNKKLFRHLVVPGTIGAICGAIMLVFLGKYSNWLLPVIAVYALFLGLKILFKAFQAQPKSKKIRRLGWLAAAGGFLDSFGGGGWGPIVTSSLIAKGRSPRYTIGSVNLAEFFITMASAVTFFLTIGVSHWNIVLGLLIGGAIASPLAARLAGKLPRRTMMIAVGIMIMIWSARMIIKSLA